MITDKQPIISIVICTKNRADQLFTCLFSLNKIVTNFTWELIVINNDSNDHTQQVINDFKKESCIVVRDAIEKIKGSGAAKNAGWSIAKGKYISFIDDDCYPEPNYINSIVDIFDANKKLGFIGGKVLLFDPTDLPITIQTHDAKIIFKPLSYLAA
jgi:glycosyltransferase involved in cell wall biosynthesis